MNILLAEDNKMNIEIIRDMLEEAGNNVVVAENGRDGIDCLYRYDFSVILMDVEMPILDGVSATKAIRADTSLKEKANIPIIAVTAGPTESKEKIFAAGVDSYVVKPVELTTLLRTISNVVIKGKDKLIRKLIFRIKELEDKIIELG